MSPHTTAAARHTTLKNVRLVALGGLSLLSVGHLLYGSVLCIVGFFGVALSSAPLVGGLLPGTGGDSAALFGVVTGLGIAILALCPVLVMSAALLGKRGRFHFVVGALIITTLVDAPFILLHVYNFDVVSLALMVIPLASAAYVAWHSEREHRLSADWH